MELKPMHSYLYRKVGDGPLELIRVTDLAKGTLEGNMMTTEELLRRYPLTPQVVVEYLEHSVTEMHPAAVAAVFGSDIYLAVWRKAARLIRSKCVTDPVTRYTLGPTDQS